MKGVWPAKLCDELDAILHIELAVHVVEVVGDGLAGDGEDSADLVVGVAVGDEGRDLPGLADASFDLWSFPYMR